MTLATVVRFAKFFLSLFSMAVWLVGSLPGHNFH